MLCISYSIRAQRRSWSTPSILNGLHSASTDFTINTPSPVCCASVAVRVCSAICLYFYLIFLFTFLLFNNNLGHCKCTLIAFKSICPLLSWGCSQCCTLSRMVQVSLCGKWAFLYLQLMVCWVCTLSHRILTVSLRIKYQTNEEWRETIGQNVR